MSLATTLASALNWASSQSLWYITTGSGCCADEVINSQGCRYDLERFGCMPQTDPARADLLIVNGLVTQKAAPHLRELYDRMPSPKYVLAIGACANNRGLFCQPDLYTQAVPVDRIVPVDIYVSGCPPRPEAVMDGLIQLQRRIRGHAPAAVHP